MSLQRTELKPAELKPAAVALGVTPISFDLVADLEARYPEYMRLLDNEKVGTSLYHVPDDEIICNIDRCLVGTRYGKAWAACSLLRYSALDVLNHHPDKLSWQKLRIGLREATEGDDEDFNSLEEFCSSFSFSIPTIGKRKRVYKLRVPTDLNATTHAIADSLGIDWNTLTQVMVIDALKLQPNIRNRDQLNFISDSFYRKLRRRTRMLAGQIWAMELDLGEEYEITIREIMGRHR